MNILFVIRDMSFIEPLGVMFLSSIARQDGHHSALAIIKEEDVFARIERRRPDMVCLSVMSVDTHVFQKLARDIKDRWPEILIIVGGPFAICEVDAARSWPVDAAVQGEGEIAFRDLLRAVDAGKPFDRIAGVNTAGATNPVCRLIEPLDQLPHPDRELVYFKGGHLAGLNIKTFMSSRGCAFRCTYCFNSKYNELYRGRGRIVRRFPVDYMIEEIQHVTTDYGATFIRFGDDVFAYKVDDWVAEFAEKYPKHIGLPFYCLMRPDLLKPELVKTLRRAGCHSMMVAIEAGSVRMRREVLLRDMDDQTLLDAFRNLHEAGIHVFANAMVGLPHTTTADEIETVELMARCNPEYPNISVLTPFRGTTLGERCFAENLIDGDYPDHTSDRSILNCFTEKEKDIQLNLVHLCIFAVRYPFLRKLILHRLIYWRPNRLFFFAWYLMKNYVGARYIFPIQVGLSAKVRLAFRALSFELSGRWSLRGLFDRRNPRRPIPRVISDQKPAFTRPGPVFEDTPVVP